MLFTKLVEILFSLRKSHKKEESHELFTLILEKLKLWKKTKHFSKEFISIVEEMRALSISSIDCPVRILTLNKSKGLDADYVFIVGVENNILPHKESDDIKIKEESRLFYVSMTRAKKELYILHSKKRDQDITKFSIGGRSEFIDAIPSSYIVEEF